MLFFYPKAVALKLGFWCLIYPPTPPYYCNAVFVIIMPLAPWVWRGFFFCFVLFSFLNGRSTYNGREKTGQGFRPFGRNGTLSSTLQHQLGIRPGQWNRGLRVLEKPAHIYLISVCVCVCVCACVCVCLCVCTCAFAWFCAHTWHRETEKELFLLSYQRLASLTPAKANFHRCSLQQF